jgi:signal recognition particle GTPase
MSICIVCVDGVGKSTNPWRICSSAPKQIQVLIAAGEALLRTDGVAQVLMAHVKYRLLFSTH